MLNVIFLRAIYFSHFFYYVPSSFRNVKLQGNVVWTRVRVCAERVHSQFRPRRLHYPLLYCIVEVENFSTEAELISAVVVIYGQLVS